MKKIIDSINNNTHSKQKTLFVFIGYFRLYLYKGNLLRSGIEQSEIYQHINLDNQLKFNDSDTFISFVESSLLSFKQLYGNEVSEIVRDNWNSLGYREIKEYEFKNNRNGINKVIETFDSIENLSIEDLIDIYEGLNISDKHFNDFFTPNSITKLVSEMVKTKDFDNDIINIYDPSIGIGRLIYHSFYSLKERYPNKIINIYGIDLNYSFHLFTQSIFELINFNHVHIFRGNTLKDFNKFDIPHIDLCLSNPPYDKKKIELDFVNHIRGLGCKSFMVLPNGWLSGKKEELVRKELKEQDLIRTIIQLPEKMFLNTNIAVNITELDNDINKQIDRVEQICIKNKMIFNRIDGTKNIQEQVEKLEEELKTPEQKQKEEFGNLSLLQNKKLQMILMNKINKSMFGFENEIPDFLKEVELTDTVLNNLNDSRMVG